MLYFLFGPDTYRSKEKLKELIKKYQTGFELQKINGENIKANEFRSRVLGASLLSAKRVFVIENMSQNKEQKEITEFLRENKMSADDILIFYEEKVNKNTSLYKFLADNAENFEFEFLKGEALKKWLRNYVRKRKGKIEPVALEELIMDKENDLWKLSHELDKLLAYSRNSRGSKRNITLEDVQLLTPVSFDDNIFNLTDAIGIGDKAKALELLNQQLESGAEPVYLLSMIIRQFRILIQVKEVIEKERFPNYNFIAQELGLHPFVVQKSITQSKKYSFEQLEKIYQNLQEIDLKLKTSKLSAESLFTRLIIE